MSSLKWTALENVGVPGILDGRWWDEGLSAGFTNSPDFLRRRGGFIRNSSSLISLSSEELMRLSVVSRGACFDKVISLEERECEIFLASGIRADLEGDAVDAVFCGGAGTPPSSRLGECPLFRSID